MPSTNRMLINYPSEHEPYWWNTFIAMINDIDSFGYAHREDRNALVMSEANVCFNGITGLLNWSKRIEILAAQTGFKWIIEPGSINVVNGEMVFVELPRAPQSNVVLTVQKTFVLSKNNQNFVLLVRNDDGVKPRVWARTGAVLFSGECAQVFLGGGGGTSNQCKVKVSANDLLCGYLSEKICAGPGIKLEVVDTGYYYYGGGQCLKISYIGDSYDKYLLYRFRLNGTLMAACGKFDGDGIIPLPGQIEAVWVDRLTPGIGGSATFNVRINGVDVFDIAHKPTILNSDTKAQGPFKQFCIKTNVSIGNRIDVTSDTVEVGGTGDIEVLVAVKLSQLTYNYELKRFVVNGPYGLGNNQDCCEVMTSAGTIVSAWIYRDKVGTLGQTTVQVKRNATDLFLPIDKPTIHFHHHSPQGPFFPSISANVSAGDVISIDIDEIENGAPEDLSVIVLKRNTSVDRRDVISYKMNSPIAIVNHIDGPGIIHDDGKFKSCWVHRLTQGIAGDTIVQVESDSIDMFNNTNRPIINFVDVIPQGNFDSIKINDDLFKNNRITVDVEGVEVGVPSDLGIFIDIEY